MRLGSDFYLACSTFEWYPGVRIWHSRDLEHWRLADRPLDRPSLLDMRGEQNSGGIWAPCLSYADGLFYLIYTDMRHWTGVFKDLRNFLVTSPKIGGPWSERVYLNSSGFDPSLFHDDDGRSYLLNVRWDFRPGRNPFSGILIQEYDKKRACLIGESRLICHGSSIGLVEGPHLYKHDGYYYLLVAEGGTFAPHAASVFRAPSPFGPYEEMPNNPLLSSADDPSLALQSSGHGCFVTDPAGQWYLAHLARRPLANGRSTLGRETCIQNIAWDGDKWPRLAQGGHHPADEFSLPDLPPCPWPAEKSRYDFDTDSLDVAFESLRYPLGPAEYSLSERAGYLRLKGAESPCSNFRQSLLGIAQRDLNLRAETCLEFHPQNFQQMAGLAAFYSSQSFHYLYLSHADHAELALGLMSCERGTTTFPLEKEISLRGWSRVYLALELRAERLRFYYGPDGKAWTPVCWELDASILSDEHAVPCGFTGNHIALLCQDLSGAACPADFEFLEIKSLGPGA